MITRNNWNCRTNLNTSLIFPCGLCFPLKCIISLASQAKQGGDVNSLSSYCKQKTTGWQMPKKAHSWVRLSETETCHFQKGWNAFNSKHFCLVSAEQMNGFGGVASSTGCCQLSTGSVLKTEKPYGLQGHNCQFRVTTARAGIAYFVPWHKKIS